MRKARILLILGLWVAVLPYLGFPLLVKNTLFSITGLGLAYFAYTLYRQWKNEQGNESYDNFSENSNFSAEVEEGLN